MRWTREQMAERAAKEFRDGFYVNLGSGIPTLVSNYIPKGMGGAMELVAGVKKVVVIMEHTAKAKDGSVEAKLLHKCSLPLTGANVVDMVITDLGVFDIDKKNGGMALKELAPGVTLEEIKSKTEATFKVPNTL